MAETIRAAATRKKYCVQVACWQFHLDKVNLRRAVKNLTRWRKALKSGAAITNYMRCQLTGHHTNRPPPESWQGFHPTLDKNAQNDTEYSCGLFSAPSFSILLFFVCLFFSSLSFNLPLHVLIIFLYFFLLIQFSFCPVHIFVFVLFSVRFSYPLPAVPFTDSLLSSFHPE